jgi:DNA (cytosine-5)-methyltransferase 1
MGGIKSLMKYLSLFTGIGGFDLPLKEMGFSCVGWSELDKYACKTFEVNFPELQGLNFGDITKINTSEIPQFNLLVGGSPCQSFSISGKREGLGGVSGLFYHYLRILQDKQPDNFMWENVRGVLSSNKGRDWINISAAFVEAGYNIKYKILNTKNYGIPQNRERVYVIGQRKDIEPFTFAFPAPVKLEIFLKDIIESGYVDKNYSFCIDANYSKFGKANIKGRRERQCVFNSPIRIGELNKGGQGDRIYSTEGTSVCLGANGGGRGAKTGLYKVKEGEIRKLSPLECFRLQGFPDGFVTMAIEAGISNSQLYKQAGNAVTTNVVKKILESLYFDNVKKKQLDLF